MTYALLPALLLGRLLLASHCSAQTFQGGEIQVPYSGTTATVITTGTPASVLTVTSGTNTFIMSVNPVNNSVRLYITNDTANSCANLTVNMFSTGNQSITSFNNSLASWQPLTAQIASGQFLASNPVTLPASGNVAATSGPIIGNKLVIQIVLSPSGSCATTNLEAQAVFGQFTAPNSGVGGLVPVGSSFNGFNPLVCGGVDVQNSNNVLPCVILQQGLSQNARNGLAVGASGFSPTVVNGTTATGVSWINSNTGGTLEVSLNARAKSANVLSPLVVSNGGNATGCGQFFSCAGLFVSDQGYMFQGGISASTGTVILALGNVDGGANGVVQSCRLDAHVVNTAGTTPTLDLYFQDSQNNSDFTDRVHFAQFTTGTANAWATLTAAQAATTPTAYTDGTLAVNTIAQGGMSKYFRIKEVVTGTGAVYTGTFSMTCK